MERARLLRAAKSAETIAAACAPLVWIALLTLIASGLAYLTTFIATAAASGRSHLAELFLEIFVRIGSIGGLVGVTAMPLMLLFAWRSDLLLRAAAAAAPGGVRNPGTYRADGRAGSINNGLKGGAATWTF